MKIGPQNLQTTGMVDRLLAPAQEQIAAAEGRVSRVRAERDDVGALQNLLGELAGVADGMRTMTGFRKMRLESSHPDLLDGTVTGTPLPGSYEFEVRSLAGRERLLEMGFPDADETAVGFGYVGVEVGDQIHNLTIEPGSTLRDVARQLNDTDLPVTAQVINTGRAEEPFRLLVSAGESGKDVSLHIDEDTTFLDMRQLKQGKNLDVSFEDVDVTSPTNKLDEVLDGVSLAAKRAEPGTRVQLNVTPDYDRSVEDVTKFVSAYNQVMEFAGQQYQENPETGRLGNLAGDSVLRSVARRMQSEVGRPQGGRYNSLAEIGVTTDYKTGRLQVDEKKLRGSLENDYEGVAQLFARSASGRGLAGGMAETIRTLRDPVHGVLTTRIKGLDQITKDQNRQIEQKQMRLEEKKVTLNRQFSRLETQQSAMQQQNQMLMTRFNNENAT